MVHKCWVFFTWSASKWTNSLVEMNSDGLWLMFLLLPFVGADRKIKQCITRNPEMAFTRSNVSLDRNGGLVSSYSCYCPVFLSLSCWTLIPVTLTKGFTYILSEVSDIFFKMSEIKLEMGDKIMRQTKIINFYARMVIIRELENNLFLHMHA